MSYLIGYCTQNKPSSTTTKPYSCYVLEFSSQGGALTGGASAPSNLNADEIYQHFIDLANGQPAVAINELVFN